MFYTGERGSFGFILGLWESGGFIFRVLGIWRFHDGVLWIWRFHTGVLWIWRFLTGVLDLEVSYRDTWDLCVSFRSTGDFEVSYQGTVDMDFFLSGWKGSWCFLLRTCSFIYYFIRGYWGSRGFITGGGGGGQGPRHPWRNTPDTEHVFGICFFFFFTRMQDTLRFPTRIINLPGYERCVPFLSFFLFFFFFKPQGAVDIEVCCTRDFFFFNRGPWNVEFLAIFYQDSSI